MPSSYHIPSCPAAWTLEQPTSSPRAGVAVNTCQYQGESKSGFTCEYQSESKTTASEPVFQFKPVCEYQASDFKLPEVKPACELKATEFSSSGFTAPEFNSSGFRRLPETEKSALSMTESYTAPGSSPDAAVERSIVKIEARFENKITGHSIWKIGTGLLLSPDLVVAGGEVVYDAEYQLGAATQVKCYIGYRGRDSSEIHSRYGQRVVFSADWSEGYKRHSRDIVFIQVAQPFAIATASQETAPEEQPTGHQEPVPEPIPEPVAEPVAEPIAILEPEVAEPEIPVAVCVEPVDEFIIQKPTVPELAPEEPELKLPVLSQTECDYEVVRVDGTPDTSVAEEPADETDPFYETLKTVSQIDSQTLDIESSLIDDVGQFVSVAAGSLVSYVVGAETISSGAATKLAGVPERALLAEASLQAVLAIEQSDELDEIIASMKQNWIANAAQVDHLSDLLAPYLSEAAKYIVEYHQEDDISEVSAKPLKRRNLGIRHFPHNESTKAFVKGLFQPTLPLSGREEVFSSLGPVLQGAVSAVEQIVCQVGKTTVESQVPKLLQKYQGATASAGDVQATRVLVHRAIMADAAYQAISTLSKEKLQVLKVIPLDGTGPHDETLFDFIKRVIQRIGPVCLHDAKQAVHKFIPLLLNPSTQVPKSTVPAPAKAASNKFSLRDYLSSRKGSLSNPERSDDGIKIPCDMWFFDLGLAPISEWSFVLPPGTHTPGPPPVIRIDPTAPIKVDITGSIPWPGFTVDPAGNPTLSSKPDNFDGTVTSTTAQNTISTCGTIYGCDIEEEDFSRTISKTTTVSTETPTVM
ncbi:hypothetical protein FGADI_9931 [Fusarium gaditjirri]|uniref:Uncharacterized protein n=1 Tax=Fusarium gaditjirri TaxID=282569 RepID=A0A8H4SYL4_9HYPO|nr:hypothetical protein FGADI_9931 [Fusarium gaditjirri]